MYNEFKKGFGSVMGVFVGLCTCALIMNIAEKCVDKKEEKPAEETKTED